MNEEVRSRIQNTIGVHDDLLAMAKKRKLRWYGHRHGEDNSLCDNSNMTALWISGL